jgi:transposase InsO family protein
VPFASPNGLFNLSRLAVWWLRLGITIERIQPGHPQQNGRHERMHRTLKSEVKWIHFNDGTERTDQLLASERECILCDLRGLLHLGQLASGEKGVKARSDKEQATEQSN